MNSLAIVAIIIGLVNSVLLWVILSHLMELNKVGIVQAKLFSEYIDITKCVEYRLSATEDRLSATEDRLSAKEKEFRYKARNSR
jgi:hypothetical protein